MACVNAVDMDTKRTGYHHGNLKAAFEAIAWDTVQAKGAEALSLRACARAAGVDPAAIYRHFKSKDEILNALAARAFGEMAEQMVIAERAVEAKGASQQLIEIGMAYVRYAMAEPHIFRMMFEQAGRGMPRDIYQYASDGRDAYRILQDGWARVRPSDGPADRFEFALWTASHGLSSLMVASLGPDTETAREGLARDVLETILMGCVARSERLPT